MEKGIISKREFLQKKFYFIKYLVDIIHKKFYTGTVKWTYRFKLNNGVKSSDHNTFIILLIILAWIYLKKNMLYLKITIKNSISMFFPGRHISRYALSIDTFYDYYTDLKNHKPN